MVLLNKKGKKMEGEKGEMVTKGPNPPVFGR